jgi:hypothetical protein
MNPWLIWKFFFFLCETNAWKFIVGRHYLEVVDEVVNPLKMSTTTPWPMSTSKMARYMINYTLNQ